MWGPRASTVGKSTRCVPLMTRLIRFLCLSLVLLTAACGIPVTDVAAIPDDQKVLALTQRIAALDPAIDPAEAARAAQIAVYHPRQLAIDWNVTDGPLVHNSKVNLGLRPAGLCYQWADALEAQLRAENFQTLHLHRAIANAGTTFRIEHSTVIVSAPGDDMFDGLVLDPWRYGGTLYYAKADADDRYVWVPREVVFAQKRAWEAQRDRLASN